MAAAYNGCVLAAPLIGFFRTRPDRPVTAAPDALAKSYRRRSLVTLAGITLGYAVFYTTRLNLSMAKKPILDEGLVSADELGSIGSMLLIAYALGKVVNGFVADRAHVGRLMGAGLIASALANLAFGFSRGVWLLSALWFVNGWCQSMGATPSIVALTNWFSHRQRGTRYSIWSAAHSLGEGLTWLFTAALISRAGWRAAFFGPGVFCLCVGVALFFAVHDRPATYGIPPPDGPGPSASAGGRAVTREQLRMLKNPLVWVLSLAGALFYMSRYGVNNWMPLYLQEAKGYSNAEAAAAMSVMATAGLFGSVLFGPISDWLFGSRRGPLVTAHGLVLIASLVAVARAPAGNLWLDRCALAACGYALGGLLVLLGGLGVVDVCPRGTSGAAVGVAGFCCYLGASLQDKISGHLIDAGRTVVAGVARYDFTQPLRFWVGAAALSTLLSSVLWRAGPAPRSPAAKAVGP